MTAQLALRFSGVDAPPRLDWTHVPREVRTALRIVSPASRRGRLLRRLATYYRARGDSPGSCCVAPLELRVVARSLGLVAGDGRR